MHCERWNPALWPEILRHLEVADPGEHAKTVRFYYPDDKGQEFYLKVYNRSHSWGTIKDLFRKSKALRALKQGEALCEAGFHVPLAVAAGEERNSRVLGNSFFLTMGVKGLPLSFFLQTHYSEARSRGAVRKKREYVRQLASEIRRLHELGFVHGDLTPFNILVQADGGKALFFLMDNDRTRRYPSWLPQFFWKRNLVQLNRFLLPGISLQDRMRFLCFYLGRRPEGKERDRRLIRWLEVKTRKRIREWDSKEPQLSFRRLMRWNGSFDRSG